MDWSDSGTILSLRRHGESAALVEILTAEHGRHAGLVRGGGSARSTGLLQPGTRVQATWRARLPDHLGVFRLETERSRAADLLGDRLALAGLSALCAMAGACLPERQPVPELHSRTETLFDLFALTPAWPLAYLRWEQDLLETLGFALDLERCAVTGARDDLAYVSPRTGRAVSAGAAGDWADRLLPLPACMRGAGDAPDAEILAGLNVTGHFLARALGAGASVAPLPAARERLVALLQRQGAGSNTS